MEKVRVGKISLKIGKKKEIDLSLEEAKELKRVLIDLFGEDDKIIVAPSVTIPYPVPVPRRPYEWWEVKPIWTYGANTTEIISICSSGSVSSSDDPNEYTVS